MPDPVSRKLAAIVVADVVGYSRLMGSDEAGTLATLTRYRRRAMDPTIAVYHGRIVKTTGDGLLLEFGSVVDAVLCAIELQQRVGELNANLPEDRRVVFRMGVNIGDVIVQDDDIFGDGVNVAARLETLAEPGGLCLSRAASDQIRGRVDAPFVDIGSHEFKNIGRPVEVMALSGAAIEALPKAATLVGAPSVVGRRRSRLAIAVVSSCLMGMSVGAVALYIRNAPFNSLAHSALASAAMNNLSDRGREKVIADFMALEPHRALVFAPNAKSRWATSNWPSQEAAKEKALEGCQLSFNEPCVLLGVDETTVGFDGKTPGQAIDMPKVHYSGEYNPAQIPAVRPSISSRGDVASYRYAANPKAVAMHVRGAVSVATNASSQRSAEEIALKKCNEDRARRQNDGPCFLYAVGDQVVLPERRMAPMSPP